MTQLVGCWGRSVEEVRRRVGGGKEGKGPGKSEGFGEEKGGGGRMSGREKFV